VNSLDIDLSVLNTTGLGFTKKGESVQTDPITELDGNVKTHHVNILCLLQKRKLDVEKFLNLL